MNLSGCELTLFSIQIVSFDSLLLNFSLLLTTESRLISVCDVEEAIWVLSLLVDLRHQGVTLQDVPAIHKEVKRVLLRESDPLSDDEAELVGGQVTGC